MAVTSKIVKKTQIVPFIDIGGSEGPANFKRIKKSTTFQLSMNPESETFDFISTDVPVEELKSYKPSLAQSLTMFKGEPDYQFIFDKLYNTAVGGDAHADVLIVFYQEEGTNTSPEPSKVWKAWKIDATIKLNTLDSVAQSIDFDLSLAEAKIGACGKLPDEESITFIEGTWAGDSFTPAV